MYEWHRQIQRVVDEIDTSIQRCDDEALTLKALSAMLGYSEYHTTRKFKELSGMSLRDYLRLRRLAFALIDVRDTRKGLLDIAVDYGFSSHEAFTRAFRAAYGISPAQYRSRPVPVVLRTKINTFDRYILGIGEIGMIKSTEEIKTYFVSIPAHKFLHIKNYESDGRRAEAYGCRLPVNYTGPVQENMLLIHIPEAEYIVFEHGPFDYEQQSETVGIKLQQAIDGFSFDGTEYRLDESSGRVCYFYHDPESRDGLCP